MEILSLVRFALRTLRRSWSVTILATVSLALAIAGNTTVYSLVNSLLNRPLPYPEPERLALVGERSPDAIPGAPQGASAANFLDWRERQTSFEALAGLRTEALNIDRGGEAPEPITAAAVSPEFFPLFRTEAARGRVFLPEEGVPGHHVAVVSHRFWSEDLGAPSELAEQVLTLNGEPYEIVGVLPEDFEFIFANNVRIWVPLALDRATARRETRDLLVVGRLAPGVAETTAEAEMAAITQRLADEYPAVNRGYVAEVLNLRHDIPDARNRLFLRMVQWALIFVLLIACANVANLLLARSQTREREIAIRTSIGASRRRIVAQLFTESMVMATVAGIVGVGLGYVGVEQLGKVLASSLPKNWLPVIDTRVLLYSLGVTVLGGLLFGLAPVLQVRRFDLVTALKDGTQAATQGGRRRWASAALVVGEIALALTFLGGTGVMIRSFQALQGADAGFDTSRLLSFQVTLPVSRYATGAELDAGVEQLTAGLETIPGVGAVTVASIAPRFPFVPRDGVSVDASPLPAEQALPRAGWLTVEPGYFDGLGIPLRRGRDLSPSDRAGTPPVAVINEASAKRFWGEADPIGQRFTLLGTSREVVGVVADVRHEIFLVGESFLPTVYIPMAQQPAPSFAVAMRTEVGTDDLADTVRAEVRRFDPHAVVTQVTMLDAFIEQFWVGQQVFTAILGGFGTLALLLAALGTYGVLAYSVVQRTHEIGVRMAIGAGRGRVVRMITRQGLTLAALGVTLGIPGVLLAKALLGQILAGFVPVESGSVLGAGLVLVVSTVLASLLPAYRAAGIDPIRALRWE